LVVKTPEPVFRVIATGLALFCAVGAAAERADKADEAIPPKRRARSLSPARTRAWFERQAYLDLHRDESWFCTDRCCEYWWWSEWESG
jgi:hypothetical protein